MDIMKAIKKTVGAGSVVADILSDIGTTIIINSAVKSVVPTSDLNLIGKVGVLVSKAMIATMISVKTGEAIKNVGNDVVAFAEEINAQIEASKTVSEGLVAAKETPEVSDEQ